MKDFIIQLYPDFKNKMKIGFTCIFKKPGHDDGRRPATPSDTPGARRGRAEPSDQQSWRPPVDEVGHDVSEQDEKIERHFYLDPVNILNINSLDVGNCITRMKTMIQEFEGKGSG